MHPDIAQGVSIELHHFLKDDWLILEGDTGFRVKLKNSHLSGDGQKTYVRETAWRLARFVGYSNFVSIEENAQGQIVIKSHMKSGDGFEIVFVV